MYYITAAYGCKAIFGTFLIFQKNNAGPPRPATETQGCPGGGWVGHVEGRHGRRDGDTAGAGWATGDAGGGTDGGRGRRTAIGGVWETAGGSRRHVGDGRQTAGTVRGGRRCGRRRGRRAWISGRQSEVCGRRQADSRRHVGDGRRTAGTVRGGGDADGGTGGRHGRRHGNRRCVGDGRQTAGTVRGTAMRTAGRTADVGRRAAAGGMRDATGGQPEPCAGRVFLISGPPAAPATVRSVKFLQQIPAQSCKTRGRVA